MLHTFYIPLSSTFNSVSSAFEQQLLLVDMEKEHQYYDNAKLRKDEIERGSSKLGNALNRKCVTPGS